MKTKNNTILITGGSSGIGLGFAKAFAGLGNKVIICGRRGDRLNAIRERMPEIITRVCDVSDAQQRIELFQWVREFHPDVNILMNNAGVQLNNQFNAELNIAKLDEEIATNIKAPVHLSALFIDHLKQKPEAAIINISSGLAYVPLAYLPVYCATKAFIHSISLSLRHSLKGTTIKVFEIAPPMVDTELGSDRREDKAQSHGGLAVSEFIQEAMPALLNDIYEVAIGQAQGLYEKREVMFSILNR